MAKASEGSGTSANSGGGALVPPEKYELLWGMVEKAGTGLKEGEKTSLYHLLLTYSDIFSSSGADLGQTSVIRHEITTTNNTYQTANQTDPPIS